jgi:ribulose-5-phosphate 4-epimerase/fuculose-1-phosphate aldolase
VVAASPTRAENAAVAVAATARLVARAGLAEGFGHVSARDGDGFAITSTAPLGGAEENSILLLEGDGKPTERPAGLPLEAPLHAAIYAARPQVGAIVRGHSPAAVVVGLGAELPPVTHGLAGMAGELARFDDPQLIDDPRRAEAAARALGDADCLLLRANGNLAVGRDLAEATVRAWFCEELARVWLASGRGAGLSAAELEQRGAHWPAERQRAWAWLRWRFGDGGPA